jgi:hypothetical protein
MARISSAERRQLIANWGADEDTPQVATKTE